MLDKKGFVTTYQNIVFVEGDYSAKKLGFISVDLDFCFGAHLKTLNDVKDKLVVKAIAMGANAIVMFRYGQKSRWLAIDDVYFWGEGVAALIPSDEYERLAGIKNG